MEGDFSHSKTLKPLHSKGVQGVQGTFFDFLTLDRLKPLYSKGVHPVHLSIL